MIRFKAHVIRLKTIVHWLLIILILAGLLWLLYIFSGRALCYIALRQIGELTNTKIKTGSVVFNANGSVFIKRLEVKPYEDPYKENTILEAEAVYARFSIGSLFLLKPRLKVIKVNKFVLNAEYDMDTGQSNLSAIKFRRSKVGSGRMPRINLEAGMLKYTKISAGERKPAISIPVNVSFGFDEQAQEGYDFDITTARIASGLAQSHLKGFWKPGIVTITGGISTSDIPDLEMSWAVDVLAAELKYDPNDTFSLKLNMKDLQSKSSPSLDKLVLASPILLDKSGPLAALQRFFDRYHPFGLIDAELEVSGNLNQLNDYAVNGTVFCRDVSFCYNKFQYAIEHLAGRIDFTKDGLTLNYLNGKHEDTDLFFNGWYRYLGPERKYEIKITSDRMSLDEDLYNALNAEQKKLWSAFTPSGFMAVDYRLSRKSQTEKSEELMVELLGVEGSYKNFPYPLENLNGKLFFRNDNILLLSDLVSQVDEQTISLNGHIDFRNINRALYDISVKVNNLQLDSRLEKALSETHGNMFRKYRPSGLADGWLKVSLQDSGSVNYVADLSFRDVSLQPDYLTLPVSDVTARMVFTPGLVIIKDFSGHFDQSLIALTGQIQTDRKSELSGYNLSLSLEQALLNDSLLGLLPESLKKKVSEFQTDGKVNIKADLNRDGLAGNLDYRIIVDCLGGSTVLPAFPYNLQDVVGTLIIGPNSVQFKNVAATLGDIASEETYGKIELLDGRLNLTDNSAFGGASLHIKATGIAFNERLRLVMPQYIRPFYDRLSPAGGFDLDLQNNISISDTEDCQMIVDFSGAVTLNDCGFNISGGRAGLNNAVITTNGRFKNVEGFSSCRAAISDGTLKIHGKSFTDLKTEVSYDPNEGCWTTEDLIADCYGGKLTGRFQFKRQGEQSFGYMLQAGFDDVDLKRFLSDSELEPVSRNGYSSGKMKGSLSINVQNNDISSRIGSCRLLIDNMQVGKLSPLAKLMQVLQMTEPKDFAFEQMFVDSYIRGDNMIIEKFDLSGQAHAFTGSGRLNLGSNDINLVLTARGRRSVSDNPSFLQSLTEGLTQAVVRMEITGDFHDPEIVTKTLPVIEETLQILGTKPSN